MSARPTVIPLPHFRLSRPRLAKLARPFVEGARSVGYALRTCAGQYAPPPHAIKMRVLTSYLRRTNVRILIETGTYFGDTISALRTRFRQIVSIEVDPVLYRAAAKRFSRFENVQLILGDCVDELPKLLSSINEPAAFWLDGHFSGGITGRGRVDDPILISLHQISNHPEKRHLLFIDDASTFKGDGSGPNLTEVLGAVNAINPSYRIRIHSDIIIALPPGFADSPCSGNSPDASIAFWNAKSSE